MSKIALVQFKASTDKKKNLPKILDYIKQAAKNNADMITFPEYMMFYTPSTQTARQVAQEAETINGEFVSAVAQSAKENSISVVGTMYEKSRKKDRVYDTSFIINKTGETIFRSISESIKSPPVVIKNDYLGNILISTYTGEIFQLDLDSLNLAP